MENKLIFGDCDEVLKTLEDNSVDAVVCDPPYGISICNAKWDYNVPLVETWEQVLVLKPGGHLLSFFGTKTYHRGVIAIEDAGFEIRDQIGWLYGSGMPKGINISKQIDKIMGAEREVIGTKLGQPGYSLKPNDTNDHNRNTYGLFTNSEKECEITAPATELAKKFNNWNTCLKPAWEPIVVARKPFYATVAENVMEYGTGGINIDACKANGRYPANIIHDGSEEVESEFSKYGIKTSGKPGVRKKEHETNSMSGTLNITGKIESGFGDSGSVSRFFYCAKASKEDRDEGNNHVSVKPTELMRYLCRLVTPPNGIVLDPWMGSGSTGKAAIIEGFGFIGIEKDENYFNISVSRINKL